MGALIIPAQPQIFTPSIAFALANIEAQGNTINLTNEGTIDWLYAKTGPFAGSLASQGIAPGHASPDGTGWHRKQLGGWLSDSFRFASGANGSANVTFGGTSSGGVQTTATGSDSVLSLAIATQTDVYQAAAAGVTGYGFSFRVPAPAGVQRVLRVRTGTCANCTITLSAMFANDMAVSSTNDVVTTGAGRKWTITYTAARDTELLFRAQVTATSGAAQVAFKSATLGVD